MIVLDTHVWVWMHTSPERLSDRALRVIAHSEVHLVSPISVWEVSTLVSRGRLRLDLPVGDWVDAALTGGCMLAAMRAPVAVLAGGLGDHGFHGDPADRLITATAMHTAAPLLTKDGRIRRWCAETQLAVALW